jgi:hypothetical protein
MIKGTSANIGGKCLKKIADEMEKAAKCGDLEKLKNLMPEIETEFTILKMTIENEFYLQGILKIISMMKIE